MWYARVSRTSHTTCLLLALVFEVTNSLAVCASGLCFGKYLVIVDVEFLSCLVLCNRRFCVCSLFVLKRMSVIGSVLLCLRWRPSIWMFWCMLVSCDLISFMLYVSGSLLMHSQSRWSLSLCGKCIYMLAEVLWIVFVVLEEGIYIFLFFRRDYNASV